jgi:hypothetical protein
MKAHREFVTKPLSIGKSLLSEGNEGVTSECGI